MSRPSQFFSSRLTPPNQIHPKIHLTPVERLSLRLFYVKKHLFVGEKNALKKNPREIHVAIIAALEQDQNEREIDQEVEVGIVIVIQDRRGEAEIEMIEDETEAEIDHVIEIEDEDNCPIIQYMSHMYESYFSSFLFVFHLLQLLHFNKLYEFGKYMLRTP